MDRKKAKRHINLAVATLLVSSAAQAELLTNYGAWSVDRHVPNSFTNAGAMNGRSDVLQVDIAAVDQQSGTFANNQGKGSNLVPNAADYGVIYGSIFVPSSWEVSSGANDLRSTALWGFAINATDDPAQGNSHYPIVGFTNGGGDASGDLTAGAGRFRVFDSNVGWIPGSYQPVQYNAWNNLCMVLQGGSIKTYVNGALAHTQTDLSLPSANADRFNRLVINTYNYGSDYSAQWSNLGGGQLASVAVSGGSGQSAAVGSAFASPLKVEARDASGAPLPCVPVTFTLPSSGPSGTSATTTVVTDYSGSASIAVTANKAVGNFEVTVSAPGLATPATLNLSNVAAVAPVTPTPTIAAVPTLGEWALIVMSALLLLFGIRSTRRSI